MKSNMDKYMDYFLNNGKYYFCKIEKEFVVLPAIGDIVQFENGTRTIVVYSDITTSDSGDESIEVYTLNNEIENVINKRGRQKRILSLSNKNLEWPIDNSLLMRDGSVIYPVKFRYKAINNCLIFASYLKKKLYSLKEKLLSSKNSVMSYLKQIFSR